MSGKTPQQMTRENLTARGYLIDTVERKKQFPDRNRSECAACHHQPMLSKSVDLFNAFDVIAIHPQKHETILVQTTDRTHHANRRNKILASMEVKLCLMAGLRVLLQSWKKNETKNRWEVAEEWFTLKDFAQAFAYPNTVAELMEIRRREKKSDLPSGSTLPLSVDFADVPF
jgi:hypothetical protein